MPGSASPSPLSSASLRVSRAAVCLISLFALVTSCASGPGAPAPVSPSASVSSPAAVGAPSGPATWDQGQIVENDPAMPVFLAWPIVPDAAPLSAAVEEWLDGRRQAFHSEYAPSAEAPPELNARWEPMIDQPNGVVGVREELYTFAGASGTLTSATFHAVRGAAGAWRGADLIESGRSGAFADAVVAALRASGGDVFDELAADPLTRGRLLDDVTFTRAGEMVVRVGEGTLLAASEGTVDAVIPATTADGLVSEAGRRVRDAYAAVGPLVEPTASAGSPSGTPAAPTASAPPSASAAPATSAPATSARPGEPVDCTRLACVALTFDDGPGPHTDRLLDVLASKRAPATFFLLGQNVARNPALVRRMAAEGHEVGNHTWDHKQLTKLGADGQRREIERGAAAIREAGVTPTVFRPPYGSRNKTTDAAAGAPVILWDVDTLDWKTRNTEATMTAALRDTKRGSIVLMHDIHAPTVDAVGAIVDGLREQGYTLVTVSELLGSPRAGRAYSRQGS